MEELQVIKQGENGQFPDVILPGHCIFAVILLYTIYML